jgi:hypothetical protein
VTIAQRFSSANDDISVRVHADQLRQRPGEPPHRRATDARISTHSLQNARSRDFDLQDLHLLQVQRICCAINRCAAIGQTIGTYMILQMYEVNRRNGYSAPRAIVSIAEQASSCFVTRFRIMVLISSRADGMYEGKSG